MPWTDILIATKWYLAIFILGFLGWTIVLPYTKKLPGFGYGIGRGVGLVLLGSFSWILGVLNIFDFTGKNLWAIVFVVGILLWKRKSEIQKIVKENWKEILISELVYLVLFIVALLMKSNKPAITDIEKYMDMAFLNATMRTTSGVPVDPWYAGSVINYYYVGHWFMATIAKMTGTVSNYAFNLGYATVMMIAGANIVVAGWSLSKKLLGGVLSVFFAIFASNVHPLLAWIHNAPNYFFFSSGRFIDQVINEYPFYSFVVGDLHAHSISLILTTLCVVVAIVLYQLEETNFWVIGFMGFLVGMMSSVNAFDVINLGFFSGLAIFVLWLRLAPSFVSGVRMVTAFSVSALIPFLIFKSNFVAPVGGVGFAFMKTPVSHVLMQFGVFFFVILIGLLTLFILKRKDFSNKNIFSLVKNSSTENVVLALVLLSGIVLVVLPEIAYFKDIYFIQNPPYARANTVFKVWYEAWMLLSISSGVMGVYAYNTLSKKFSTKGKMFAVLVLLVPILVSGYGTKVGLASMKDSYPNTIDGLDYIRRADGPQDFATVEWATKNISGQPIVLEATGQSYSTYDWFSAFTGLPTIIGWESHEWGWRYDKDAWNKVALKMGKVETIYKTKDVNVLRALAQESKISYILVSPNERTLYGVQDDVIKKAFGEPVFNNGKSVLYKTGY